MLGLEKLKKAVIQIIEQQRRKDMKCLSRLKLVEVKRIDRVFMEWHKNTESWVSRQLVTWVYVEYKRISI